MSLQEVSPGVATKTNPHGGPDLVLVSFPEGTDLDTATDAVILLSKSVPAEPIHVDEYRMLVLCRIHGAAGEVLRFISPTGTTPERAVKNVDILRKACAFIKEQELTRDRINSMMRQQIEFPDVPGVDYSR